MREKVRNNSAATCASSGVVTPDSKAAVESWVTDLLASSRGGLAGTSIVFDRFIHPCAITLLHTERPCAQQLSAVALIATQQKFPDHVNDDLGFRYPSILAYHLLAHNRNHCNDLAAERSGRTVFAALYPSDFIAALMNRSLNLDQSCAVSLCALPDVTIAHTLYRAISRAFREELTIDAALADALDAGIGVAECVFRTIETSQSGHSSQHPLFRSATSFGPLFCVELGQLEAHTIHAAPFLHRDMYAHLFTAYALLRLNDLIGSTIAHSLAASALTLREHNSAATLASELLRHARTIHRQHRPDHAMEDIVSALTLLVDADRATRTGTPLNSDFPDFVHCMRRTFPKAWVAAQRDVAATYLNRTDLPPNSTEDEHRSILRKVSTLQSLGLISRREDALVAAGQRDVSSLLLLERTGAKLRMFLQVEPVSKSAAGFSTVTRYSGHAVRQFPPTTPAQRIHDEITLSGNYPALVSELPSAEMTPETISQLIRTGEVESLVALEYFAADLAWKRSTFNKFSVSLKDVTDFRSAFLEFARIQRKDNFNTTILLCIGYQGRAKHTGSGLKHIQIARAGDRAVKRLADDGSDEAGFAKLLDNGIIPALAESDCWITSAQQPSTHTLITEKIRGSAETFVSVVVAPVSPLLRSTTGGTLATAVTAIVHPSADKMLAYLIKQCTELVQLVGEDAGLRNLAVLNAFLSKYLLSAVEPHEIGLRDHQEMEPTENIDALLVEDSDTGLEGGFDDLLVTVEDREGPATQVQNPPSPILPWIPSPSPIEERIVFLPLIAEAMLADQ